MKIVPGRRSSVYNAFTDNSGGLVFGVGDMAIHAEVSAKVIRENREMILSPDTREAIQSWGHLTMWNVTIRWRGEIIKLPEVFFFTFFIFVSHHIKAKQRDNAR